MSELGLILFLGIIIALGLALDTEHQRRKELERVLHQVHLRRGK